MSYFDTNMANACAECGRRALEVRDRLKSENAELRKLVQIAFRCQSRYCDGCPMESPYNTSIGGVPECRFEREAIRLGVDVDVWNEE